MPSHGCATGRTSTAQTFNAGVRTAIVIGGLAAVLVAACRSLATETTNELVALQSRCKDLAAVQFKLAEARPFVDRLLTLTLELRGEMHPDTVIALHWVAFLAQNAGRYAEAEQTWLRSLAIQEKLPAQDPVWFSRTLHMLAGVAMDRFDFPLAENYARRALKIREETLGPDHPETAGLVRTLGRLSKKRGHYAQAESRYLQALAALERAGRYYETGVAEILSLLGQLYVDLGDLDKAEPLLARALETNEKFLGPEHSRTINNLNELGTIRRYRGDLAGAEALYQRSLRLREKLSGPGDISLCWSLHQLAEVYLRSNRFSEAEVVLQRMLAIVCTNLGPEHPALTSALDGMGRLHERRAEYPPAKRCFEQALQISERHLGPDSFSTTGFRRSLARIQFALGHPEAALASAGQIQDGEEKRRAEVLSFTSERQRLVYQSERASNDSGDLWATMGAAAPLARAVLRTKGVVLDSLLEDRLLAEASGDPELRRQIHELSSLKSSLAFLRLPEPTPGDPSAEPTRPKMADIGARTQQAEKLEADLARRIAGLGGNRRALCVRVEQVQESIPADAALVEFIRYRHYQGQGAWQGRYGALVLTRRQEPRWVPLGEAKAIDRNVKVYQHSVRLGTDDASLVQLLTELNCQLWVPLARALRAGTRRVILCPDGDLNFLSFATLLTSSNQFVAEDYDISYVSSGRDLIADSTASQSSRELLVWANPDFGGTAKPLRASEGKALPVLSDDSFRGLQFDPLPGAEMEGRWLRERAAALGFTQAVVHLGPEATEAKLASVESPAVLHFATHGFVVPEANSPASDRSETEASTDKRSASKAGNPMLRCGLALAGAKCTLEAWAKGESVPARNDGIVTAEEIGCLKLRGTRLVVVSACDAGLGEARAGEGVLGLRRGFIQAGAQNLLLTLWPIADRQTSGLIPEFYTAAHQSGSPAAALAKVQRSWLKQLREAEGVAAACRIAGPFILSFQGNPNLQR